MSTYIVKNSGKATLIGLKSLVVNVDIPRAQGRYPGDLLQQHQDLLDRGQHESGYMGGITDRRCVAIALFGQ